MTEFLRLTIFAPLASWGEPAVGEVRASWDRPSRSAVLGLLAAALGIRRDDETGHNRLDGSVGIAVRSLARGEPLVDYHTTQNPRTRLVEKHRPETRAIALALGEPETALSRRSFWQDALYLVAVWSRPNATLTLVDLADALRSPAFTLYAGRKANVLGLPLAPELVEAGSLADALRNEPTLPDELSSLRPSAGWGREVAHDACDGFGSSLIGVRSHVRRDASPIRVRWQFSERTMYVGRIPEGA